MMVFKVKGGLVQHGMNVLHEDLIFRLNGIERIDYRSQRQVPQRHTSSYVWVAGVEGESIVVSESGKAPLRAGSLRLFAPEQTFGIESGSQAGFGAFLISFDVFREEDSQPGRLRALSAESWPGTDPGEVAFPGGRLQAAAESIWRRWKSTVAAQRMKARAEFLELVSEWASAAASPEYDSQVLMQQTKTFIDEHYREPLKLEQLAGMAGLSRNYYVDQFKKHYGKSVVEYMTDLRIRRAKRLMANSELKLREVAQQVGYNDEFYFSRRFKQETGVTPSAYMKSRSRRIAAYCTTSTGYLLALGVMPYAAPLHPKWTGYYHSRYAADIPVHLDGYKLGADWQGNLDRLKESHPEYIVCSSLVSEKEKDRLEQMAPVIYISPEDDWRTTLRQTAIALGETEAAERWLESYQEAAATIGRSIGQRRRGERTLLLRFWRGGFYSAGSSSAAGVLREDLGINLLALPSRYEWEHAMNPEMLNTFRADRILLMVCQEGETLPAWEAVRHSPEWAELPAVRAGRLHMLPSDPWRECSPSAHKRVLREAARIF
ncbi:AraC family transcriptional regulator [Saccharibacillus sacchari]|uniref:AraC family transcriptional regulator n=1 Tax=Saccharibacillus sacchari TaxID=456493 RepID=A0ACC6PCY4_9BACL